MNSYQLELLNINLPAREKEVIEYQVNIDNYRRAIAKIENDENMKDFKIQLEELLKSSIYEQRKAQIILEVIREQIEENK